MKRTTVKIPEALKTRVVKRANSMGISLGEFIRDSLKKKLKSNPHEAADDSFLNNNSVYKGDTPADLSRNHDQYLYVD